MGSTRFPGKVMADLDGKPLIGHLVSETRKCGGINEIVFAIPEEDIHSELGEYLHRFTEQYMLEKTGHIMNRKIRVIAGPEQNVAERFRIALDECPCDYFIRICADAPLIKAKTIHSLIHNLTTSAVVPCASRSTHAVWNPCDLTEIREGLPQLVKTEAFLKALPFFDDYDREHVTTFFTRRLVVDTPADLDYVRRWHEFSKLLS